jgi:hypothetical protein
MSSQEKRDFKKQGKRNKRIGNEAERKYARIFREAGWKEALTMRYVSKMRDDRKLDLAFVPVNAQIKAGAQNGLNVRQALRDINTSVEKLPAHYPERKHHAIVIHDKLPGRGNHPSEFDSIVSMTFTDYFDLLCMLHEKGKYSPVVSLSDEEGNPVPINEDSSSQTIENDNQNTTGDSSSV